MYRTPINPVPPGWFDCPPIGEVSDQHQMIPMKVPLGNNRRFPNMEHHYSNGHWTPMEALHAAHAAITAKNPEGIVGMVLDLSNSDKYYDPDVFRAHDVRYVKVPCRGRGMSPDPLAVNMAVWEIRKALNFNPSFYILVHCTHGFNRSGPAYYNAGFIIVSAAMRLLAQTGYCVERGIRYFSAQRPPGIYKNDYINDLFARHNEIRPRIVPTPDLPAWKPADDEDEDERLGYNIKPAPPPAGRMTHADKVGDPVSIEEARYVMNAVYDIVQGQDNVLKKMPLLGFPHLDMVNRPNGDLFVGSQPVSLDLQNLDLVKTKRYFVTWKADGTRYMMLVLREGVYLIDRAGEVRRTYIRFPTLLPQPAKPGQYPVGPPHHWTLLDGEMVVDDVDVAGEEQRRRYLVYDCMMLAGEGVSDLSFGDRYQMIEKQILRPMQLEKDYYVKHKNPKFLYDWKLELCSIRRKEFWPLYKAKKLLSEFIPKLCHESDGLILQPWDDPYIPRTYPHLLKWKFSHMNSVDFKLFAMPGQPVQLQLNCAMRRKYGQAEVNHLSLRDIGLGEQRVEFPPDINPLALHGKIVECNFDAEQRMWRYMRERPDKLTANHRSVFDKVMASIFDNINEDTLLAVFDEALQTRPDIYKQEQEWINNPQSAIKPAAPAPAAQQAYHEQHRQQPHVHQQYDVRQQQRSQTPEVRPVQQQQQQQPPKQGFRGPSPLTPPPGVIIEEQTGRIPNAHNADGSNGLVDDLTPGLGEEADAAGANGHEDEENMEEQGHQNADVDDFVEDEISNDDAEQQFGEQQFSGQNEEEGDYRVTEDDGVDGDEDYHVTEEGLQDDGEGEGAEAMEEEEF